jgi:NAD(P)-dependent dehydrogenase (short-subunit alcohol dehydrogenase family)
MCSHTGAARAGIDNLTKSLVIKWVQDDVRVNAVATGSARTTREYNTCTILQSII